MKTNVTCSVEINLLAEAQRDGVNVSALLNDALKERERIALTPMEKASEGMVKQLEVKERLEREGKLEKLQAKYFKLDANLRELLKEKVPAGMNVYVKLDLAQIK